MESGLAASQRFMEFCAGACEVLPLLRRHGADFATAAGVYWVELGGDDRGWDGRDGGGRCFMGEQAGDEGGLEGAGVGVSG